MNGSDITGADATGTPGPGRAEERDGAAEAPHEDTREVARRFALDEAADGELTPELAERLRQHWETCPECVEEVERVLRMKELVRRCCAAETAPASLRERISIEVHRTRTEVSVRTTRSITVTGP
ncbi:mycothiol system anti-sigma-R factor [Brachybacterium sp. AOP25-B2-12]|uniref:mycothiol system anti-sigma-R factor n=1 Tax=Brachybacterium sp. AOP25-B2-12 TaxID=3457710 RepID=UPI00403336C3